MTENHKDTAAAKKSAASSAWHVLGLTGGILLLGWVGIAYVAPQLSEKNNLASQTPDPTAKILKEKDAEITALSSRIGQLEAKLQAFEDIIATAPLTSPDQDKRIEALQDKLDKLQTAPAAASNTALTALEASLTEQQQNIIRMKEDVEKLRSGHGKEIAIATAFTQLQDAAYRGDVFHHQVKRLAELTAGRKDIQDLLSSLAPASETGLPTGSSLLSSFEAVIPHALSPHVKPDSIWANLRSLVRIRKTGNQPGSDDASIIARAEVALKAMRVAESLRILTGLSPAAAVKFADWRALAEQSLSAKKLLEALQVALAKTPEPEAPPVLPAVSESIPPVPANIPEIMEEPAQEDMDTPEEEAPAPEGGTEPPAPAENPPDPNPDTAANDEAESQ